MKTPIIEKRFHDSNPVAKLNRERFAAEGVLVVSIGGGPGCGKTTLIESTINLLGCEFTTGVIACDVGSHLDGDRISQKCDQVVQVNAGPQGLLDATHIRDAMQWLDLDKLDLLLIEKIGTLVDADRTDLGQTASAAIFSVAGGHDKAEKHPEFVRAADAIILNKTDLLTVVPFVVPAFRFDVDQINASVDIIQLSALTGEGVNLWIDWLKARIAKCQRGTPSLSGSFL